MCATQSCTASARPFRSEPEDITHERLPERWVDLIQYLDAQEREREEAQQKKRLPAVPH
jgi:hypothetical protein